MGLSIMNRLGLCQVYVSYIEHFIENSFFRIIYKSSVSTGFAKQIMLIVCILFYNGSLVIWTVVSLTTAKFKRLIFSVSGFALSCTTDIFILMILYDFRVSPAQFFYVVVILYIWKDESSVRIADRCAPWKISSGAENLVLQALQLH
jgi:hypothetical protein